jgi:L-ascorbate metabolism protein UlaG (beta-lactamase superfamily)
LPRVGVEVAGTPVGEVAGVMQPQAMQAAEAMQEEAPR